MLIKALFRMNLGYRNRNYGP